jgi:hypothetical protein
VNTLGIIFLMVLFWSANGLTAYVAYRQGKGAGRIEERNWWYRNVNREVKEATALATKDIDNPRRKA